MDEFMGFLIVGLVIMAVFIIAFASMDTSNDTVDYFLTDSYVGKITNTSSGFFVGRDVLELYKPYNIGNFNTSYKLDIIEYDLGERRLFSGVLFGSESLKFEIQNPESMQKITLNFMIKNTNNLADLDIKLNGKLIEKKRYNIGEYKITLDNSVPKYIIELVPESSGWQIWSPNIYELTEVIIHTENFIDKQDSFTFDIDSDTYVKLTKVQIDLDMVDYVGALVIRINNKDLFSDNITRFVKQITFDRSIFEVGKNTVTFASGPQSEFVGNAKLKAFYTSEKENVFSRNVNLSGSSTNYYNKWLRFKLDDVIRAGGLSVKIKNGNRILFEKYDTAEKGRIYTYHLINRNVAEGMNEIIIAPVDNSAFVIDYFVLEQAVS